jgi:hypothetical protein
MYAEVEDCEEADEGVVVSIELFVDKEVPGVEADEVVVEVRV